MDRETKARIGEAMIAVGPILVLPQVMLQVWEIAVLGAVIFFLGVEVYLYHRKTIDDIERPKHPELED